MLTELRVKNFALIDDLCVSFKKGLNVITGETGAGKSLVLKSLHLLMGGKAPSDLIGDFGTETHVEGLFSLTGRSDLIVKLKELSYLSEGEDSLLVRRIINSTGKSKTFLNGSLATVGDLRGIVSPLVELTTKSEPLVELTSQHDHKNLQNPSYQRDLFDVFCKVMDVRNQVSELYSEILNKERELKKLNEKDSDRLQKIDFLNFQLSELSEFSPKKDEYTSLKLEKKRLDKIEKLRSTLMQAKDRLNDNDSSALSNIYSVISDFKNFENEFSESKEIIETLNDACVFIDKALAKVRSLNSGSDESSEANVSEISDRLKTYEHLFRKYNTDSEGLSEIYLNLSEQKNSLEKIDALRENREYEIKELHKKLTPLLGKLSLLRNQQHERFETEVNQSLVELNMKGIKFKVKLEACDPCQFGQEDISFWLSYAEGETQERTIKKAASGGELSRILLAIKGSLENQEAPRTYLFDEIDAGVSGPTAEKVGKKLKSLSKGQQVITITHLPQVASLGDHHFLIEKSSGSKGHQTSLLELKGSERVSEVARLISGEKITDTSLKHASKLMDGLA